MDRNAIIGAIVLIGLAVYGYARMFIKGKGADKIKDILPKAKVIDVRSSSEYKSGAFPGAVNIPLDKLSKQTGRLGAKEDPKVVYCASGSRARQATRLLRAMGFRQVYNGGTLDAMKKLKG